MNIGEKSSSNVNWILSQKIDSFSILVFICLFWSTKTRLAINASLIFPFFSIRDIALFPTPNSAVRSIFLPLSS
jgi:hypothetical protein